MFELDQKKMSENLSNLGIDDEMEYELIDFFKRSKNVFWGEDPDINVIIATLISHIKYLELRLEKDLD